MPGETPNERSRSERRAEFPFLLDGLIAREIFRRREMRVRAFEHDVRAFCQRFRERFHLGWLDAQAVHSRIDFQVKRRAEILSCGLASRAATLSSARI